MSVVKVVNTTGGTSSQSGGASSSEQIDNVSSQVDGTNINFSTTEEFQAGSTKVYYNGVLQIRGEDYTEDGDGFGVTFALAPEQSTKVIIIYFEQ